MANVNIRPRPSNKIRVFAEVNGHSTSLILDDFLTENEIMAAIVSDLQSELSEDQFNLALKSQMVERRLSCYDGE